MGDLILADFATKTWHREATLEERAAALVEQFNRMAEPGTEVVCELVTTDTGDCA